MTKEKPVIDFDYNVAYSPRSRSIISLGASDAKGEQRPKIALVKSTGADLIEKWGDDNTFPQQVVADVKNNIELSVALGEKAKLISSLSFIYGIPTIENGVEVLKPVEGTEAAEIRDFLRKTAFHLYKYECAKDLVYFYNAFPEIILSQDRSKIVQISIRPAEQCRWSKQNTKTGYHDFVYVNANWDNGGKADDTNTIKIPVLDPYYDPALSLLNRKDSFQYIFPISIATPGDDKYQTAEWNAVRASKWLSISAAIPKLKEKMLNNIMLVNYHISFSNIYWSKKYTNWASLSEEARKKIMSDEVDSIETCLQGYENAGKNIISSFFTDPVSQKNFPGITIEPIDKKVNDEIFLKDDERTASKVLTAVGLHPALFGFSTATGQGQGGGSDIREAYNLNTIKDSIIHEMMLAPLNLVRDYNKWNPDIEFRLQPKFMTTLDKGKEVSNTKT